MTRTRVGVLFAFSPGIHTVNVATRAKSRAAPSP